MADTVPVSAPPLCPAPAVSPLQALADQCVQCGLCLPTCPTYALEGLETESPRGRIALIRALDDGRLKATEAVDTHLDHCLGCRRCESVCPAGVRYGDLLGSARASQRSRRQPGLRQRLVEHAAARPGALSVLLCTYRFLFPLLPRALRPLPRPPARTRATFLTNKEEGETVALFLGCVARGYETNLQAAVVHLARAAGASVVVPDRQTCCGTLHAHAGNADEANRLAGSNRSAFGGHPTVLTLASGCHAAVDEAVDGNAIDAIAFLAARADRLAFAPRPERVALHLPCTQRNVVRSDGALRTLLARVPGLEIVPLDAGFGCCGAAGTAMLDDPDRAGRFRQPLLDQFAASGATRLLSANIGCRLHLGNGTALPVLHPLELLAECLP